MRGTIASIWRSPVKGLTLERLAEVQLAAGQNFPGDRAWAVEVGDSGFDPEKRNHVSKMKFTVLARFPQLARIHTRLDDETGRFHIGDAHGFGVATTLDTEEGRTALARFLAAYLGEDAPFPLKVLPGPNGHAFMDTPGAHASIINLASVRAVEAAIGRPVDPLRFRGNFLVDGWDAWAEDALAPGAKVQIGDAELTLIEPCIRCIATHASPETGERDIDMLGELRTHFDRKTLGMLCTVTKSGWVKQGDAVEAR